MIMKSEKVSRVASAGAATVSPTVHCHPDVEAPLFSAQMLVTDTKFQSRKCRCLSLFFFFSSFCQIPSEANWFHKDTIPLQRGACFHCRN